METCSNQKNKIGGKIEDFAKIYNSLSIKARKRVKICVDTAHIFEAGYDIRTDKGVMNYFNIFNKLIGLENLEIIHLNDSATQLGSTIDKHAPLGEGYIFSKEKGGTLNALKKIFELCYKNKILIILETHYDINYKTYKKELKKLKDYSNKILKKSLTGSGKKDIKNEILSILKNIEVYYRTKTNNSSSKFRGAAYSKAIKSIEKFNGPIYDKNSCSKIKGLSSSFINKIDEIEKTGTIQKYKKILSKGNTKGKEELLNIIGLGPVAVNNLIKKNINNIKELKIAIKNNKIKISKNGTVGFKIL